MSKASLNRFFSLHYLFPFVLVALAIIHLIALQQSCSDKASFHYYYVLKDLYGAVILGILVSHRLCFSFSIG